MNKLIRPAARRAFSLAELVIVLVIIGILAAIAIVSYQAIVDRAALRSIESTAQSFDRQVRALAAFDTGVGTVVTAYNTEYTVGETDPTWPVDSATAPSGGAAGDLPDGYCVTEDDTDANVLYIWAAEDCTELCDDIPVAQLTFDASPTQPAEVNSDWSQNYVDDMEGVLPPV
jgi:prepilin-type N-terminal cleavage/methylation domain-containing protein